MVYDVFISYSRRDMYEADKICQTFQSVGLSCFTDRNCIPPGADYIEYLEHAIRKCKIFLYIASQNSYDSKWSHYELQEFLKEQSIQGLYVYIIDGCQLPKDLLEEINEDYVYEKAKNGKQCCGRIVTDLELAIDISNAIESIIIEDDEDEFLYSNSVFISHSHADNAIADKVYTYLLENNIKCWIDLHDIPPGKPYAKAIIDGIQESDCLIVLYSKNVLQSNDILNEIEQAHTTNKRIIPFLLDRTPMVGEFRYYLARKQWIIAYPKYEEYLEVLLQTLKKVVSY